MSDFQQGLFGCFSDCTTCLLGCFVPCYLTGKTQAMLINVNAPSAIAFAVPILISPDNKLEQNTVLSLFLSSIVVW
jgi:Cys-rich protein (TIGR01571 family)